MKFEDSFTSGDGRDAQSVLARNPLTPLPPATRDALVRLTCSGDITVELRAAIEREIAASDARIGSIPASEWMKQSNLA